MRRLPFPFSILIRAGFVALCAVPTGAQLQVIIAGGAPIVDNDVNDTDKKKDSIGFVRNIDLGGGATAEIRGHAFQIPGGKDAKVEFDRLQLTNTGTAQVTTTVEARSSTFAAVGPPFTGRVHVDGHYTNTKGPVVNSSITVTGTIFPPAAGAVIGTIAVPAANPRPKPVQFGPGAPAPFNTPDQVLVVAVGVTQIRTQVAFTIAPNDRIVAPGSIFTAGYTYNRELIVNSALDLEDGDSTDGVCDTGNQRIGLTGICTLRAALTEANFSGGQSTQTAIHFNIPGNPVIKMNPTTTFNSGSMGTELSPVVVDGLTQPGGSVEVDGSTSSSADMGGNAIVGLDLTGAKISVLGLIIHNFPSHGISIHQSGTPFGGSDDIEENLIGSNGGDGIHVRDMPDNVFQDNVIASNIGQGVSVGTPAATGNSIRSNSILANGGSGIALTNGGNNLQPPPALSAATLSGIDLTVGVSVNGPANTGFTVDFYSNHSCDSSGSGEGESKLGSAETTTDGSGNASFTATLSADFSPGDVITATATDDAGNTSEFSACETVQQGTPPPNQPPVANAGSNQTVTVGTPVTLNGTASFDPDNGPSPLTFAWTQFSGPEVVTLTGANTATPNLTPTVAGTYVFSLVVNDGAANSAPASVTITVLPSAPPGPPGLITTAQLSLLGNGSYQTIIIVKNNGTGIAQAVTLTRATLGAVTGSPIPVSLGDIQPGASATAILTFPSSAGAPGTAAIERYSGTFTGGIFGGGLRVTLP